MKSKKLLGIWMDHSVAYLTELTNDVLVTEIIKSQPKLQAKEEDLYYKDESHMLNKEQKKLSAYYKKLSDVVLDYDEVILFGPTDAKNELLNIIKDDHLFDKIKIEALAADKMTENQRHIFIKQYFNPTA